MEKPEGYLVKWEEGIPVKKRSLEIPLEKSKYVGICSYCKEAIEGEETITPKINGWVLILCANCVNRLKVFFEEYNI